MDLHLTLTLLFRLIVSGLLGAFVGLNREMHAKTAGLRTHFFVCFGSALFMIISKYAFLDVEMMGGLAADPSRVAAGVVSGIGFLCAGTIIFSKRSVKGLTTAAGLWATSAIGLAAGAGLYFIAVFATAAVWLCYEFLAYLSFLIPTQMKTIQLEFAFRDDFSFKAITNLMKWNKLKVIDSNLDIVKNDTSAVIKMQIVIRARKQFDFMTLIDELSEIYEVKRFDLR